MIEIFPENLKIVKLVLKYKKDDQSQIKNYRPISVLPVISKIFKNAMHNKWMEYFTNCYKINNMVLDLIDLRNFPHLN